MATKIFVNLAVKDLDASIAFFQKLGYHFNQQFTDKTAACMVIAEDIYAMFLTHEKYAQFTSKRIVDAHTESEVGICLSADSKEDVDAMMSRALNAGGTEPSPAQDYGFMYGRNFDDLDGHSWEIVWMDPAAVQAPPQLEEQTN